MSTCDCAQYLPLELLRKAVDDRIRVSKPLRNRLKLIAEDFSGEHQLYKCPDCATVWQRSLAWNWGNKEYVFAVPEISLTDWKELPYVQPDELLIFAAVLGRFFQQQKFEPSGSTCRSEGCCRPAVKMSVFCVHHHIVSLQGARMMPQDPVGRWFPPYQREGFAIPA
jgi:hypothetical protein